MSDSKVKTHKPEATKDEAKEGAETAAAEEPAKETTASDVTADKPAETATAETPAKPVTEPLTTTNASGPVEKDEATTPNQNKRTSIFGTLKTKVKDTTKSDKSDAEKSEGEEKKSTSNKLGGIFRNPSKAIKSNTTPASTPAKKDEAKPTLNGENDKPIESKAPAAEQSAAASEPSANAEGKAIGDVVPEAVSVGQEQGAPAVQATA